MKTPRLGDVVYLDKAPERFGIVTKWDGDKVRISWSSVRSSWHVAADVRIKEWAHTTPIGS
jgi:hypothetical protein